MSAVDSASSVPGWLRRCCDEGRPVIDRPRALRFEDAAWTVATDGHVLVAVRQDHGAESFLPGDQTEEKIAAYLADARALHGVPISLSAFREFLGSCGPVDRCATCQDVATVECPACYGRGTGTCECPRCNHTHERTCEDCRGRAIVDCPECIGPGNEEPALITGREFDRRLFRVPLRHLDAQRATWAMRPESEEYGAVRAADWIVIVMPRRSLPGETAHLPSFTTGGA